MKDFEITKLELDYVFDSIYEYDCEKIIMKSCDKLENSLENKDLNYKIFKYYFSKIFNWYKNIKQEEEQCIYMMTGSYSCVELPNNYEDNLEFLQMLNKDMEENNEEYEEYFRKNFNTNTEDMKRLEKSNERIEELHENHEKTCVKNNKVFIVHGRDNEVKVEVTRIVEKLGLTAVILHEQANAGNTIIEKIEKNTDVGYAIILYTPCDIGKLNKTDESLKNRARQNVVFEHGYLTGKLGRKFIFTLVKEHIEIPSDIQGLAYTDYDEAGAWKLELVKNLKAVGYDVDANKL